jgi:predicted MFS family arabinose efflux permease
MWSTNSLWFDVAMVMSLFGVGNICFGRFEEHKPRWRRLLKVAIVLAVTLTLSATVGRTWAYAVLALPLVGAAWIHLVWLPRNGINGWTAEPRDRYLALVTRRR